MFSTDANGMNGIDAGEATSIECNAVAELLAALAVLLWMDMVVVAMVDSQWAEANSVTNNWQVSLH